MSYPKPNIIFILSIMFLYAVKMWAFEDRVVRINADTHNGVSTGTGFFWEVNGTVLTAYHVVNGATKIRIYYAGKIFDDIELISYSNEYDLALLKIINFHNTHKKKFYEVNYAENQYEYLNQPLVILAYPWGWAQCHRITGAPTYPKLIKSRTIKNKSGFDLFSKDIDVISLDVTVFGGMSGAPVIMNNMIIGILSGSLDEGGSIAWAVPLKYVKNEMIPVNISPQKFDWPDLALMNHSNWRSLKFEKKRPKKDFNIQLSGLTNVKGNEYDANIIFFYDNYTYNISYGFEIGLLNHYNTIEYETLSGINEQKRKDLEFRIFPNLFLLKKYYHFKIRPYYGLSFGFPCNIQLRAGTKFFSKFCFETRCIYFNYTKKSYEFNSYGDSYEKKSKTYKTRLFFGINYEF